MSDTNETSSLLSKGKGRAIDIAHTASAHDLIPLRPNMRPQADRAITTIEAAEVEQPQARRPTLMNRVTDTIFQALAAPSISRPYTTHIPAIPTNWADEFEAGLLRLWDTAYARTVRVDKLKPGDPAIKDIIAYVKRKMLQDHPELRGGDIPFHSKWVGHILAKNLRRPFRESDMLGRWELLSTAAQAGGARAGWGPW